MENSSQQPRIDGGLTLPIGEKPELSRNLLSAKLMKSCRGASHWTSRSKQIA